VGYLRIQTLGSFSVKLGQEKVSFDTDKTGALLTYLVVEAGRPHPREHLAGLLWSDLPQDRALHNLRQSLSHLRKVLHEDSNAVPFLFSTYNTIQWNVESDTWLDLRAFQFLLDRAYKHHQRRNGHGWLNPRALKQALSMFQGLFLDKFFLNGSPLFDEWAALKREEFNAKALQALEWLSEYHDRRREYTQARQIASRIIELAPWEESARAHLMRLLALDGQWSAAQNQYMQLRRSLNEQLGVGPTPQTTALFEEIRQAATGHGSISPRFSPSPTNLPETSSVFIGRNNDLDDLADRISDPECRLLTLLGVGGIGKTRLAIESAREHVGIFRDGVYFVSLLSASSATQLPAMIANALGMIFTERGDPQSQLIDFLRRKNILLLLDNFEYLLNDPDSTPLLSEIFHQAPDIMILVTSRERLNLQEERILRLSSMNNPPAGLMASNFQDYDACLLFIRRAQQALGDFEPTENDLAAIARVCRLLDGLPLGVELAAAATWDRTCQEIADLICNDLNALNANASNAPSRHRSLSAAFDLSWQQLNPVERELANDLSVFLDGFNYPAALAITNADPGLLDTLVDKSLLNRQARARFRMHEAVRQYAGERLAENEQRRSEIMARHAGYFLELLADQEARLLGSGQAGAIDILGNDLENIRCAWAHALDHANLNALVKGINSLYHFYNITSRFSECIRLFSTTISKIESYPGSGGALAMTLSRLAALAYRIRNVELLDSTVARAATLLPELEDAKEQSFYLTTLGAREMRQKDYDAALECALKSQQLSRAAGDLWGEGYAIYMESLIYSRMGQLAHTLDRVTVALEFARRSGNERSQVAPLNLLADALCVQGRYDQAEKIYIEALGISQRYKDRYNQAIILNNLATIYHMRGDRLHEKETLEKSLAICREIGDRDGETIALNNLGEMCVAQQKYEQALEFSRQALTMTQETREEWSIIVCQNNIGEAHLGLKNFTEAERHFLEGLVLARKIRAADQVARIVANLASINLSRGNSIKAGQLACAVLAHSATEEAARALCRTILESLNISTAIEANDDTLLDGAVTQLLSS
jgi:predicted ATPase/DNA-binding SARP family transcriptional activator